ncbi:PrgI family protein, partial [Kibdelosporangium lantanae]
MTTPVRIPADIDMADRVLGPLTARQLAILAGTGLLLYLLWTATHTFLPPAVYLVLAVPIGATAAVLALGR